MSNENDVSDIQANHIKNILNLYQIFYRQEIENIGLFDGLTDDLATTNIQFEYLYADIRKYKEANEEDKNINAPNEETQKYVIYENDSIYGSSKFIVGAINEILSLQLEKPNMRYKIKLNK